MLKFLAYGVLLLGVSRCGQPHEPAMPTADQLMEMNRLAAKKEALQIQRYIDEHKWPAIKTGSGLQYYIYEHGTGDSARTEMRATVKMTIMLLNGDTCYTSKATGEEHFIIDYDHNESGLHEAIKKMRAGDKAKIILPSHLAFGVAGDQNRIPQKSSVVYDLELVRVE